MCIPPSLQRQVIGAIQAIGDVLRFICPVDNLDLQVQLEGTENRINIARRDYNEAVREYNTTIRTFPDIIGAKIIHGAEPLVPFEADAGAEKAPEVFGKS